MSGADPRESSGVFLPTLGAEESPADQSGQAEDGAGLIGVGADLPTGGNSARSRLPAGTIVLLLVVAVAGGVLYIMRQFGLGTRLDLVDVRIDYPIDDSLTTQNAHEHEYVLSELRDSAVAIQVPLKEVKKNPFALGMRQQETTARIDPGPAIDPEEQARRQRERLIQNTLNKLELNSVVGGAVPIARISGQNVRAGDIVADLFLVQTIRGRSVDLVADGETYTLTMGN